MTRIKIGNLFILLLCLTIALSSGGCKSKQKLADQNALEIKAENAAKAKALLTSILNDDGKMTLAEKEQRYNQAKGIGSDDPEVLDLMAQVEAQLNRERSSEPMINQPEVVIEKPSSLHDNISALFGSVASANSTGNANNLIDSGLDLFSSPNALVLIIISKSGDIKDYDEPTTISKYLNYLKDQKANPNKIFDMVLDDSGKIKELELIKK